MNPLSRRSRKYKSLAAQTVHYFGRPHRRVRRQPLHGPAAWLGSEMAKHSDWRASLSEADVADLDAAVAYAQSTGKPKGELTKDDFPLRRLEPRIAAWREALSNGRGFQLIGGVPVDRWSQAQCELFFWCFGLHLGRPGAQNPEGDLLGHVRDTGADPEHVRHYRTNTNINFHCDAADVVGLLCLRSAKSGGASRLVSSVSVYNALLSQRPDLVEQLYKPFQLDTHGEGGLQFMRVPPVRYSAGQLRTFYHTDYFRSAPLRAGARPLNPREQEALDRYNEIADSPGMYLDMTFLPGDIQLVNNHTLLHARTGYEDHDEPDRKRHLLRLWLSLDRSVSWRERALAQREKLRLVTDVVRLRLRSRMSG